MDFGQLLHDLIFDYTLRNIALGSAILGIVSGVLGSFALLRRQGLLGDALAHAALPGVCAAFVLSGGSREPIVLLLGAAVSGWIGALLLNLITRSTRIKDDAAMGIVLSTFFGLGYVMLSLIQRSGDANQAGLDKYLFGSAASLIERDVTTMALLAVLALGAVFLLFKEFKLLTFDPAFLASQGYPVRVIDFLLTTLITLAIVIGLQTVGVVLMSAMLIAPGAAARQWTNRLGVMILVAMLIGVLAGVSGAAISWLFARTPTGPAIVLALTAFTALSFAFGSERGLIWTWLRTRRNRATIRADAVLADMLHAALRHNSPTYAVPQGLIRGGKAGGLLRRMASQGLVEACANGAWALTAQGHERALEVGNHNGLDRNRQPVDSAAPNSERGSGGEAITAGGVS